MWTIDLLVLPCKMIDQLYNNNIPSVIKICIFLLCFAVIDMWTLISTINLKKSWYHLMMSWYYLKVTMMSWYHLKVSMLSWYNLMMSWHHLKVPMMSWSHFMMSMYHLKVSMMSWYHLTMSTIHIIFTRLFYNFIMSAKYYLNR